MKHSTKKKAKILDEFIAGIRKRSEELKRKGIDLTAGPPGRRRALAQLPDVAFDLEEDLTEEK